MGIASDTMPATATGGERPARRHYVDGNGPPDFATINGLRINDEVVTRGDAKVWTNAYGQPVDTGMTAPSEVRLNEVEANAEAAAAAAEQSAAAAAAAAETVSGSIEIYERADKPRRSAVTTDSLRGVLAAPTPDEVADARGSTTSLNARISRFLYADGAPKVEAENRLRLRRSAEKRLGLLYRKWVREQPGYESNTAWDRQLRIVQNGASEGARPLHTPIIARHLANRYGFAALGSVHLSGSSEAVANPNAHSQDASRGPSPVSVAFWTDFEEDLVQSQQNTLNGMYLRCNNPSKRLTITTAEWAPVTEWVRLILRVSSAGAGAGRYRFDAGGWTTFTCNGAEGDAIYVDLTGVPSDPDFVLDIENVSGNFGLVDAVLGSSASGCIMHKLSVGGNRMDLMATTMASAQWQASARRLSLDPNAADHFDLFAISLGGNDQGAGVSLNAYETALESMIASVRAVDAGTDILISGFYQSQRAIDESYIPAADYNRRLQQVAWDLGAAFIDPTNIGSPPPTDFLDDDNFHPNGLVGGPYFAAQFIDAVDFGVFAL